MLPTTIHKIIEDQHYFIIEDVSEPWKEVVLGLNYALGQHGYAKAFSLETPNIEQIFGRFQTHLPSMLNQIARKEPTPWQDGLLAFLNLVAGHNIDWRMGGSTALTLRGIDVQPRDIDLIVDSGDGPKLANLMHDYLVEPPAESDDYMWKFFGRTFLHCRLEWIGDPQPSADQYGQLDFGPFAQTILEEIDWRGHKIRVPPLDLQLKTCEARGLTRRTEKIKDFLAK